MDADHIKLRVTNLFNRWEQQINRTQETPSKKNDEKTTGCGEGCEELSNEGEQQHRQVLNESIRPSIPNETDGESTGRAKGGKGLGIGGVKRHRKILRDSIQGISKPAIRRLARRTGVQRISSSIYEEARGALHTFLQDVIRDTISYTEASRRKTVTITHVLYGLKRHGRTLYDFES